MSGTVKLILWIIIAIAVLGGLYYWYTGIQSGPPTTTPSAQDQQENAAPALASGSATFDTALEQDLSGLDTQMSAMDSDTAAIDSGLTDKQVPQEQ